MYFKGTPTRGVGEIAKQTKAVGGYLNAGDDLRSHQLLHGAAVVGLRAGARRAGRRLRAFADRRRRAGARARGHHPGSEAQSGQSRRRRDRDAVRAAARPSSHSSLAHRTRAGPARAHARRARRLLSQLLSSRQHGPARSSATSTPTRRWPRCSARTARCRPASRRATAGRPKKASPGFRYRELSGRHRADAARVRLAHARHDASRHAVARPPRRRCSAAAARRDCIAPCASAGSRRRSPRTTTRRPRSACSSCTPRRRRHRRPTPRARCGSSCARFATATSASSRSSARSESTNRSWLRRLEDMEGQANYLAEWEALGDWRMGERYLERLLTTTRDDLVGGRAIDISIRTTPASIDLSSGVARRRSPRIAATMRDVARRRCRGPSRSRRRLPYRRGRAVRACRRRRSSARRRACACIARRRACRSSSVASRARRSCTSACTWWAARREEAADLAGLTTLMVRTALKGTTTRSALQIAEEGEMLGGSVGSARRAGELRLVDLGSGASRRGRDRAARRRRAASARSTTTRSRPSARSRSPTSSRCATTCIAIRCGSRRRRRSPAIRTACRRVAPRRRWRASIADAIRRVASRARADVGGGDRARRRRRSRTSWRAWPRARSASCDTRTRGTLAAPEWPRVLTTSAETRDRAQTALDAALPRATSRRPRRDTRRR